MVEIQKEESNNKKPSSPSDHLANERTFLAWIRTSIALMGFGFVIVKFALFVRQISIAFKDKAAITTDKGTSAISGVIMVAFGAIMATLASLRYRNIEKQLNQNSYFPSKLLSLLLTLFIDWKYPSLFAS